MLFQSHGSVLNFFIIINDASKISLQACANGSQFHQELNIEDVRFH